MCGSLFAGDSSIGTIIGSAIGMAIMLFIIGKITGTK